MKRLVILMLVLGLASAANAVIPGSYTLQTAPAAGGPYTAGDEITLWPPSSTLWIGVHNSVLGVAGADQQATLLLGIGQPPVGPADTSWTGNWVVFQPPLVGNIPALINEYLGIDDFGFGLASMWLLNLTDGNPAHFQGIGVLDAKELHCDFGPSDDTIWLIDALDGAILDTLTIHQIPEPATVPNVVGMTQADANAAIIAAGFTVGTITVSANCGPVRDFRIISSDPGAGAQPGWGTAVATVRCECFAGQGNYASWVTVKKPLCWCYPRQCHGDADGKRHGVSTAVGYWWVGVPDLNIMSLGYLVKEPPKGSGVIGRTTGLGIPLICADFGHDRHGTSTSVGYWWVGRPDLDKMAVYWLKKEPPKGSGTPADCEPKNRNP